MLIHPITRLEKARHRASNWCDGNVEVLCRRLAVESLRLSRDFRTDYFGQLCDHGDGAVVLAGEFYGFVVGVEGFEDDG